MAFGVVPKLQAWVLSSYNWSPKMLQLLNHPAGPFTIHFWCPLAKWGIVIANLSDLKRPAENISTNQQCVVTFSGLVWSRYSLIVTPRNVPLFAVNFFMSFSGLYQLFRKWAAGCL
jgi:hypothetical protein